MDAIEHAQEQDGRVTGEGAIPHQDVVDRPDRHSTARRRTLEELTRIAEESEGDYY